MKPSFFILLSLFIFSLFSVAYQDQQLTAHTAHQQLNPETNTLSEPQPPKACFLRNTKKIQRVSNWTDLKTIISETPPKTFSFVLFDALWCKFSIEIRRKVAVLADLYPSLPIFALDAYTDSTMNVQFSIFGFPTIIIFNSTQFRYRFDSKDTSLRRLSRFVANITGFPEPTNLPDENEIKAYLEQKTLPDPLNTTSDEPQKENPFSGNPQQQPSCSLTRPIEVEELFGGETDEPIDYYLYFSTLFLLCYGLYQSISFYVSLKEKQD